MRVKIVSDVVEMQVDIPEEKILRLAIDALKYAGAKISDEEERCDYSLPDVTDDGVVNLSDEEPEEKKPEEPVCERDVALPHVPRAPALPYGGSFKEAMPRPKEDKDQLTGYRGFLHIKCSICGEIKSFCTKNNLHQYKCSKGHITELHDLTRMYVKCKCGKASRYFTNIQESPFVFECFDCGAPVDMIYHDKKGIFVAMGATEAPPV